MAVFAGLQVVLTFGGLLYIRWTLKETRKAVAEAAKATEAAQVAVGVTREAAERQLRAYLHVGSLRVTDIRPGQVPVAHYITKNAGQTPALMVVTRIAFFTDDDPLKTKVHGLFRAPATASRATFGAQQEGAMSLPDTGAALTEKEIAGLEKGSWGFGLAGYITYRDVFGRQRRTVFRSFVRGEKVVDGELRMSVAHKHVRSS